MRSISVQQILHSLPVSTVKRFWFSPHLKLHFSSFLPSRLKAPRHQRWRCFQRETRLQSWSLGRWPMRPMCSLKPESWTLKHEKQVITVRVPNGKDASSSQHRGSAWLIILFTQSWPILKKHKISILTFSVSVRTSAFDICPCTFPGCLPAYALKGLLLHSYINVDFLS